MINPVDGKFILVFLPKIIEKTVIVLLVHNLAFTMLGILVITLLAIGYLVYRWHIRAQLPRENQCIQITSETSAILPTVKSLSLQSSKASKLPLQAAPYEEASCLSLQAAHNEEVPQAEDLQPCWGFDDEVPAGILPSYSEQDLGDGCEAKLVGSCAPMYVPQEEGAASIDVMSERDLGEGEEGNAREITLPQPKVLISATVDSAIPQYSTAADLIKIIRNPDLDCFCENDDDVEKILMPYVNDFQVMLAAAERDGQLVRFASESLQQDRRIAVAAVRQNGTALRYLGAWQKDKDIVAMAIISGKYHIGQNLDNGEEIFTCALAFASDELQNDVEMARLVAKYCPKALDSIGNKLWANKKIMRKIVIQAVQKDKEAFKFARSFENDPEVLAAFREPLFIA